MFIVLAIIAFGFIIAVHELGHYIAAKALGVKVNEFAVGMGPKIFSWQGKETLYSIRLLPFGGFCAMEDDEVAVGEGGSNRKTTEDSETIRTADTSAAATEATPNPRAFSTQSGFRRVIILTAGSFANFVIAFIIVMLLTIGLTSFTSTTISEVRDNFPELGPTELMPGDRLLTVNGERLFYRDDFVMFMSLNAGNQIVIDFERNGERMTYFRRTHIVDGVEQSRYAIVFEEIEANAWERLKYSLYRTYNFVRMIRVSLTMMFTGEASMQDVVGPVGIVDAMNAIGRDSPTIGAGIGNIVFFTAFIGVNVAVVNMLPIPAMDGGRIFFIFLTWIIEKITKKKLNPKYEGYVNTAAFFLLIGLMVLILYNDVTRIIDGNTW